jgi:hypothetical protein
MADLIAFTEKLLSVLESQVRADSAHRVDAAITAARDIVRTLGDDPNAAQLMATINSLRDELLATVTAARVKDVTDSLVATAERTDSAAELVRALDDARTLPLRSR